MIQIIKYLNEKLKISSKTQIDNDLRDLSDVKTVPYLSELCYKTMAQENTDWNKAAQYFKKKSNPLRLVNSIKDRNKLIRRWWIYVKMGWQEAYQVFRDEIVKRGYYTEDELDKFALNQYNNYKKRGYTKATEYVGHIENYLIINNVKYS